MTIAKALTHVACAAIMSAALTGCDYGTGTSGWYGPYAATDYYEGYYGPDFFADGVGHRHLDDHYLFHYGSHGFRHGAGFGGFHSGGMHIAHAGGFGGHGRG